MSDLSTNEPDFFRVVTVATVISLAILGAVLGSVRGFGYDFNLDFSAATVIGAAVGGVCGWAIWRVVRKLIGGRGRKEI